MKMLDSAVLELFPGVRSSRVAVVLPDDVIQIWDSRTAERISEFKSAISFGHSLALNPRGTRCAVGSWKRGKRGGVACYDVRSSQISWHRTDIRYTQLVRFASDGKSIYCGLEYWPLLRLDVTTGETIEELIDVVEVYDSPDSGYTLMACCNVFVVEGRTTFQFPRTPPVSPTAPQRPPFVEAALGSDCLCLVEPLYPFDDYEPRVAMRCVNYQGGEMWRYELPKSTVVSPLSYRKADRSFYGVEWDAFDNDWRYLVRYSPAGDRVKIRPLESAGDAFCRNGDILVTSEGEVIEVALGKTIHRLEFPKRNI